MNSGSFSQQLVSSVKKAFSGVRSTQQTLIINSIKPDDEQIILMSKLLEEMDRLRRRFDELQDWYDINPAGCDAAREKLLHDVHYHASEQNDSIELLLKSFATIRNLMEEVQHKMRPASRDAI